MKAKLIFFTVLTVVFLSTTVMAGEKVTIAACNYEPYYGEKLKEGGAISKITRLAFKAVGYEPEIVQFKPWARVLVEGQAGRFDVIMGVWKNTGRENWMALSHSMINNEVGLLKRRSERFAFKDLKGLKANNMLVGTVRGYANPKDFDAADINIVESSDDEVNVSAMLRGRYGFVLIDKNLGFYLAKNAGKGDDVEWVVTLEKLSLYNGIIKNGPKDWKKLLNDFNKGLDTIKKNGTFAKVMEEYSLK